MSSFKTGDRVKVVPLSLKVGRIIGSQSTSKNVRAAYLVRYEVDSAPAQRRSETALYFDDELRQA